ncbi:MAG: efflux RND transporter periplasmic adaptor subunit [Gammaproteobacteria bacterium]|nr:efflux RND transporter periplasmic adaptor subunit [Gammaproteobacteria bacterium]
MKRIFVIIALLVVGVGIGFAAAWVLNSIQGSEKTSAESDEPEILYWVAPMDDTYRRDKPGLSPMGMDLVPVYAGGEDLAEDEVQINPLVEQNMGIRTSSVKKGTLNRKIQAVGYVEYDENALHHIHTRVEGWIEKLSVKDTGDPVKEGQVLFEIYSPELVNAQEEYLLAKSNNNQDMLEAAAGRLEALGLSSEQIQELNESETTSQRVRVFAKSDGVVGMLGVREGTHVTPATHTMSIAELDKVWIVAEILERQSSYVEVGQKVEFELEANPGRTYKGSVDYIYPELDPTTRSLQVRIMFETNNEVLRPNMFARVSILVEGSKSVLHIPSEAVIRGGLTDRVVLAAESSIYRSVPVVVGMEVDARVHILDGLKEGDTIVTSGQFLIDSESNIEVALARYEEEKKEDEKPTNVTVSATIRGFDREGNRLRIKHGKIPEWNWKSMTMYLPVAEESLFDGLEKDQEVILELEQKPGERAKIIGVKQVSED